MRRERDTDIDMRRAIDAIKEKYEERERQICDYRENERDRREEREKEI